MPVNRCRVQSNGVCGHAFGGHSRFFSAVVRPDASTKPVSAADKLRLTREITWSVMLSSAKIGFGGLSLSPADAQWTCR